MTISLNSAEITNALGVLPVPSYAMVIEDEATIGVFLSEFLTDLGYNVCAITSTEGEAVSAAAKYLPDLVIVDAKLRSGSGIAAMEKILQKSFVPHVFISGYNSNDLNLHPQAIFLQKPFSQVALARAISKAIAVVY